LDLVLHETQAPHAQQLLHSLDDCVVVAKRGDEAITRLLAIAVRPPERRVLDGEAMLQRLFQPREAMFGEKAAAGIVEAQPQGRPGQALRMLDSHPPRYSRMAQIVAYLYGAVQLRDACGHPLQPHLLPWAGGQQAWAPIPAVVILRLTDIDAA